MIHIQSASNFVHVFYKKDRKNYENMLFPKFQKKAISFINKKFLNI